MTIPEKASIAKRPFFNSFTCSLAKSAGFFPNPRGSKAKSPCRKMSDDCLYVHIKERDSAKPTWGTARLESVDCRDRDNFQKGRPETLLIIAIFADQRSCYDPPKQDLDQCSRLYGSIVCCNRAHSMDISRKFVHNIGKNPTKSGKHGNPAMLQLGFAEKRDPFRRVGRKLQRIKVLQLRSICTSQSTSKGHLHTTGRDPS